MSSSSPSPNVNKTPGHDEAFWIALFAQDVGQAENGGPISGSVVPPPPEESDPASPAPPVAADAAQPEVDDAWQAARRAQESDEILHLEVRSFNKGGLIVYWRGLQGFVPASQLVDFPQFHIEPERLAALADVVGRRLRLKVIELNPDSNRLILSERASQVSADERDRLLESVQPGDRLSGVVSNLTDFGAFVDLGGVEGLIHISELSWSRVTHPSKVLQPGDNTDVVVLSTDPQNGRIALSRKRLHPNPWDDIEARYQPGQLVSGTVSNVVSYGAFVRLEPELEGLIHISELAEGNFLHPRNVVRRGDRVQARVLAVNGRKKRLALSLRAVPPSE